MPLQTVDNRQYQRHAIHHSDRGLQYCSKVYQTKLNESDIIPSMTDGYNCYQNEPSWRKGPLWLYRK
jgi:transposase InsO family protein